MENSLLVVLVLVLLALISVTHASELGFVEGSVIESSTKLALPFVNCRLRNKSDSIIVKTTGSDSNGKYLFTGVPWGEYYLELGMIGYKQRRLPSFTLDAQHPHIHASQASMTSIALLYDELVVTGEKALLNNSIDRKVYNIDKDVMSKSGSVSELLQTIPSLQVDIDGNVSIRGSANVVFLMDGKSSPMLRKYSAEVLQDLPANSIERIEVITNPSAKYKPDGTAGIVNIVTKQIKNRGVNGTVTLNGGNRDRYNGTVLLNYHPNGFNVSGSYSLRRDRRDRFTSDVRSELDSATNHQSYVDNHLDSYARPISNRLTLDVEKDLGDANRIGLSGNYFLNKFTRTETMHSLLQDSVHSMIENYNRLRYDPEYEKEIGYIASYEHDFGKEDHKIRFEYNDTWAPEQENNHYTNDFFYPTTPSSYDNMLIKNQTSHREINIDYTNPLSKSSSFEAGYAGEFNRNTFDYLASNFDTSSHQFYNDLGRTNSFGYNENFNAVYATYKQEFGGLGMLMGLRVEQAITQADFVTIDSAVTNRYTTLYPTLHLSEELSRQWELQFSYSRRTHRPEAEDINPFPEYRDPHNLFVGNPRLRPEYVHSIELGCQYRNDIYTITPALFYRYNGNRDVNITKQLNDTVLLTTRQNLSFDQAGGLEVTAGVNYSSLLSLQWNGNIFYDQIDATNIGYSNRKSTNTWSSTVTVNVNFTKNSRYQINTVYRAARLTPQGEFAPNYVVNTGYRQDLLDGQVTLSATAADLFNTLNRRIDLNTSGLNQTVINTRDTRIFYLGVSYHFGYRSKGPKEEQIKYDNGL